VVVVVTLFGLEETDKCWMSLREEYVDGGENLRKGRQLKSRL